MTTTRGLKTSITDMLVTFGLYYYIHVVYAYISCEVYLLFSGGWKLERAFIARNEKDRIEVIAAVTGSLFKNNVVIRKVFYPERKDVKISMKLDANGNIICKDLNSESKGASTP
jgi:hypothetical protein